MTRNELVLQQADTMRRLIAARSNPEYVEDILQDVIVEILSYPKNKTVTTSYANSLAINRARNYHRNLNARWAEEVGFLDDTHEGNTPDPETAMIRREEIAKLEEAIGRLRYKEQRVIDLTFRQERSIRDASKLLYCSVGTVDNIKRKAIKKLRRYIRE